VDDLEWHPWGAFQAVKAGDLLVRLQDEDFRAQVEK
jgi:multidrug resistance efflux pump